MTWKETNIKAGLILKKALLSDKKLESVRTDENGKI
jgi:hypothetical protein